MKIVLDLIYLDKNGIHDYLDEVNELIINGDLFLEFSSSNFPYLRRDKKYVRINKH